MGNQGSGVVVLGTEGAERSRGAREDVSLYRNKARWYLEGQGRFESLMDSAQIRRMIKSREQLERDALRACSLSAMCRDVLGFRLEIKVVGKDAVLPWLMSRMCFVEITQVFEYESAPSRLTSVKGFYALYSLLQDFWNTQRLEEALSDDTEKNDGTQGTHYSDAGGGSESEDREECPICMDGGVEVVPPCGHGLCQHCFDEWNAIQASCPSCRAATHTEDSWVISEAESGIEYKLSLMSTIVHFISLLPFIEGEDSGNDKSERNRRYTVPRAEPTALCEGDATQDPGSSASSGAVQNSAATSAPPGGLDEDLLPRSEEEEEAQLLLALSLSQQTAPCD